MSSPLTYVQLKQQIDPTLCMPFSILHVIMPKSSVIAIVCFFFLPTLSFGTTIKVCDHTSARHPNCHHLDYSPNVFLVHITNWSATLSASKTLSKCGFSSVSVDISRLPGLDLRGVCIKDRIDLALTVQVSDTLSFPSICPSSVFLRAEQLSCDQSGLTIYTQDHYPWSSSPLSFNRTLCVATVPSPASSFVRAIPPTTDNHTRYEGMVIQILDRLAEEHGFRYTLVTPEDGEYGIAQPNGSFTGMSGMVQRRECDVIAADFSVTYSRSQVLDFSSVPFHYDAVGILINLGTGRQQKLRLWTWSNPFDWKLWICFVVSMLLVSGLLYLGHKYAGKATWAHRKFVEAGNCFLYICSCYVAQGIHIHPKSWWSSILLAFWWLLCLLEIASYGGFLIAVLTAPPPITLPFETLEGMIRLLESGDYRACIQSGTRFHEEVQNSDSQALQRLGQWLRKNPHYVQHEPADCVRLLLSRTDVAFLAEITELEAYQRMHCQNHSLIILPPRFCITMYALAFQKGSPYASIFSSKLLEMIGDGLTTSWYKNYSQGGQRCTVVDTAKLGLVRATHRKLSLDDVCGIFVLFLIGIGVSLALLGLERIAYVNARSRRDTFGFGRL